MNENLGFLLVCAQILDLPAGGLGCNVTAKATLLNGTRASMYVLKSININTYQCYVFV